MRDTLPRVLDNMVNGALVVSMYDHTVVYANPEALKFLPDAVPDASMDEVVRNFARRTGIIRHPHQTTLRGLAGGDEPPIVVDCLPVYGGLWVVATKMDPVQGFPPSAIITYHLGPETEAERLEAVGAHMTTAFAARMAVQLDETARDIRQATELLVQSHQRSRTLTEALIELVTEYPTLGSLHLAEMAAETHAQ